MPSWHDRQSRELPVGWSTLACIDALEYSWYVTPEEGLFHSGELGTALCGA